MGGGDLNLKKSWDPRRLDNQEKKWKREEMDKKERQRSKELKEEREEERALEEMRRRGEDEGVIEKRKDRLDWMYKGPGAPVNPDDYLLGKEVDRAILDKRSGPTQSNRGGSGSVSSVGAVIRSSSATSRINAKDLARKMREDPLFAIKKRELNNRKELVSNPIRMKQLQQMLQTQVGTDKKKSKKAKKHKEKKSKKHKKSRNTTSESDSEEDAIPSHSRRRLHDHGVSHRGKNHQGEDKRKRKKSPDSSSESDSDEGLDRYRQDKQRTIASLDRNRMKQLLEREMLQRHRKQKDRSESSSSESDSNEEDSHRHSKQKKSADQTRRSHSDERRNERITSPPRSKRKHGGDDDGTHSRYGLQRGGRTQRRSRSPSPDRQAKIPPRNRPEIIDRQGERQRDRSPHSSHKHYERYDRSQSPQPKRDRYSERSSDSKGEKHGGRGRSRSRSPVRSVGRSADRYGSKSPQRSNSSQRNAAPNRKLTAEEMERKRAEMMDNAKWRDDQRKSRVMTYEKEEQAEVEMEKKTSKDAKFVQPLKLPENSSVEDRIHRNIYNIQRTKAALDKNFAKR